ncbi:indole-3-glycerol phosphate synthase TrpC [Parabacteroides sp. PF5-6]|uniref:indole-3-glycerol phosphate synthase TrpC n=1 Tax=Parabacteroides sp. PF5-6 TaxID=1742403 RepID=UPI00240759CA|nr:indole-3-glycerol phosphate synthase TrpC [Parabacteroides sp. PF5-6]MDF9828977.1 indole-3-glycerol phosphate synthase [Parabacteroides sp. PF5-6]
MDILEQIIATKRIEVAHQKEAIPLRTLLAMGNDRLDRNSPSMRKALAASPSGIIAEFKRKSPSKGWLHPDAEITDILPLYEQGGAAACSILTDKVYFGGSLNDLQKARKQVDIPLLRKDFIIDPYQIYQAKIMGADAILLIAACLTTDECRELAQTAHSLGLEVLLEIHSSEELKYLNQHIDLLGVNNRNLGSFHTDINNSFRLIEEIKQYLGDKATSPLLVAESGISQTNAVKALRATGFQGFLIGETFMKTGNPGLTLSNFIQELL